MKWMWVVGLVVLAGCATIDGTCPTDGSTTIIAIGGATVGNDALAAAQGLGKAAGMMAKAGDQQPGTCHVHYTYIPIFGSDYVKMGTQGVAPTPLIITVPAGPPPAAILK